MSQSEAHINLIKDTVDILKSRYADISILVDLQQNPGDGVPPKIGGFRPDIYARDKQANSIIIAEAKTDSDIDTRHTCDQITSFIKYLDRRKSNLFVLSVTGSGADRAKTVLRFICKELQVVNTEVVVFDCCDFWGLDSKEGIVWHLY